MADAEEELSIEELRSNLANYKEQLKQVEKLLAAEPGNAEYEEIRRGLLEVIELTQEVLPSTENEEATGIGSQEYQHNGLDTHPHREQMGGEDHSRMYAVGTKVQAVWTGDGEWYNATIEAITPIGYVVVYDEWGNKEEVDPDNVREREGEVEEINTIYQAEKEAEAARLALKRKIAAASGDADLMPKGLPAKLQIKPEDPEDVKAAKKKKIHAFKSRVRLEKMEFAQNKRQNAWQQFQSTKGKSRKVGYFTGGKRESIFKSPDDPKGKVGVTGSGKGITEFQKREKYMNLKVGTEEEG